MPISPINVVVANRYRQMSFSSLLAFYRAVTTALTGSLTFPTPPVTLADQGLHADALEAAILQWGPLGNRGSHADYVNLLAAQMQVFVDLATLSSYVQATVRVLFPGDYTSQAAAVLTAAMRVKDLSNLLPSYGAVNDFRQLVKKNLLGSGNIALRWKHPDVLAGANSRPPAYNVYSAANNVDPLTFLASTSSTSFIDNVGQGVNKYYAITPVSAAGEGASSPRISCFGQ